MGYNTFSIVENFIMPYLWTTLSIHGFIYFQYTISDLHARQNSGVPILNYQGQTPKQTANFKIF